MGNTYLLQSNQKENVPGCVLFDFASPPAVVHEEYPNAFVLALSWFHHACLVPEQNRFKQTPDTNHLIKFTVLTFVLWFNLFDCILQRRHFTIMCHVWVNVFKKKSAERAERKQKSEKKKIALIRFLLLHGFVMKFTVSFNYMIRVGMKHDFFYRINVNLQPNGQGFWLYEMSRELMR